MMFLIRFWRKVTKKDSVESAKYFLLVLASYSFRTFFSMDPDFLGSDPDSGKKV